MRVPFRRYAIGGLLIGVFWYLNRGRPPWEEALRTVAVFTVVILVLRARLRRKAIDLHVLPLLLAKAALVGVAAVVQSLLARTIGDPALPVAIGLGSAVALLGPAGDSVFFSRTP